MASSRTYNQTSNGTFGQYIPAIPFSSFVAKAAAALSLQQIAQNASFRTNLGIVEGSGNPATVLVSVFGNDGAEVTPAGGFPRTGKVGTRDARSQR